MKIAIHHTPGSFSDRWIEYCKENDIPYKIVNAYDTDIVKQLNDCDGFMWHHSHAEYKDVLFAKQLLYSLQIAGKKVFPDFNTGWHFDDKVGQKYLLEAINAPLVPSYVFYTKKEAMKWIETSTFPKVFKLRGGAGASNVWLVRSKKEAKKYINKAFGKGFPQFNRFNYCRERFNKWRGGQDSFWGVCKGVGRLFIMPEYSKMHAKEKGYVYFQDFIPNNQYDIRVIAVNDKAFAIKRLCRKNDFRASGSGRVIFSKDQIDERCVKIAFQINKIIKSSSIAFDFVFDSCNNPLVVEISYGFSHKSYDSCEGFWDKEMKWHPGPFNCIAWIIEDLIHHDIHMSDRA